MGWGRGTLKGQQRVVSCLTVGYRQINQRRQFPPLVLAQMVTLRCPWNELSGATEIWWSGTLLLPRNIPSGAREMWWLVSYMACH